MDQQNVISVLLKVPQHTIIIGANGKHGKRERERERERKFGKGRQTHI